MKSEDWAKLVVETRELFGDSQKDFADRLGATQQTISLWEKGQLPRKKAMDRIEVLRSYYAKGAISGKESIAKRDDPQARTVIDNSGAVGRMSNFKEENLCYDRGYSPTRGGTTLKSDTDEVVDEWLGPFKKRLSPPLSPSRPAPDQPSTPNISPTYEAHQPTSIPLISWVQAGDWWEAQDQYQPGDADEWLVTTETDSPHSFALTVHGDSMEPEFVDGDIITVDPDAVPDNGSYVVAKNGHEATFKQLVLDGQSVFLKPLNGRYPIRDMTGIDFRIVGVVVEKRKRYGKGRGVF